MISLLFYASKLNQKKKKKKKVGVQDSLRSEGKNLQCEKTKPGLVNKLGSGGHLAKILPFEVDGMSV